MSDLPPRTWRSWWLEWPKWLRIGCYAALGMVLLQVVIGVRITIGLLDGPEITELQRRKADFSFLWEDWDGPELFEGQHTLAAGLLGRSGKNVRKLSFRDQVIDADLAMIGQTFQNLEDLDLEYANISCNGIKSLRTCRRLRTLVLTCTPVDDAAVAELTGFDRLTELYLSGTLITDSAVDSLMHLDSLEVISLSSTDVTSAAIERLKKSQPNLQCHTGNTFDRVNSSIAWSDGMRSVGCMPVTLSVDGPLPDVGEPFTFGGKFLSCRRYLLGPWRGEPNWSTSELMARGNGDYLFVLNIGEYSSAPVTIRINDGLPMTDSVEFRMPCTESEAMRSVKVNEGQ